MDWKIRTRGGADGKGVAGGKRVRSGQKPWLVVGLGNFGCEYEDTRHNCGFCAVDRLADKLGAGPERHKFKGVYREALYRDEKLILLKPGTYMNRSGESITEALHWYKLGDERLLVLYDDCDIALGSIRVRPKGSAGTHNGMKSVLQYTDGDVFPRVRIGIGQKPAGYDLVNFVLGRFTPEEMPVMEAAFAKAADAALCIIENGCECAMALYNGKADSGKAVT